MWRASSLLPLGALESICGGSVWPLTTMLCLIFYDCPKQARGFAEASFPPLTFAQTNRRIADGSPLK